MLENAELVYQAADAFNLGVLSAFLTLCDRNVEFISRLVPLEGGKPGRGQGDVRSWWETLHGAYRDLSVEIDGVREFGEVTVAQVRLRGRRERGATMQQTQWHVVRWRQKKAIRWRVFLSETEALAAADSD
jgi:SnoaL-like domain